MSKFDKLYGKIISEWGVNLSEPIPRSGEPSDYAPTEQNDVNLGDWEKYYDPNFDWNSFQFYIDNKLSEEFIREFQDKVDWDWISQRQKLSEDFIREFQDKVDWDFISAYQTLSEDFIREFQDKVDWYYISQHQTLSPEFREEFKDKL